MKKDVTHLIGLALSLSLLAGCTYNPFVSNNHTTGSPAGTIIGAGAGAGGLALLNAPKWGMVLGGIGGGAIGYYVTTLRYTAGGVIHGGGQVYKVGDYVGIYIPTDNVFDSNTAEFLPQAGPILDSAAAILMRYPNNNIIISGNTSGFYRAKWEQRLSEQRGQKIAAYLWNAGINDFKNQSLQTRKLNYVGYGDFFPVATTHTNDGLRENSRIQITSYPSYCDLGLGKRALTMQNYAAMDDADTTDAPRCDPDEGGDCPA